MSKKVKNYDIIITIIGGLSNMLENMDLHFITLGVAHCALG